MNFLVIDDEQLAADKIKRLLESMGYTHITTTTSAAEGVEICKYRYFDVIFLDINMPEKMGLEVAKEILYINAASHIVFTTAYDQYALESYKIGAIDYLMKPVTAAALQGSIHRVNRYISSAKSDANPSATIMAKDQEKITLLKMDDIYIITAHLSDTSVRTKEGELFTGKKISDFNAFTSNRQFVKVHRSQIINIYKIAYLETIEQGKYRIHFKEIDEVVYTSRSGAQLLRELFEQML
ncbi:MAG: response regulator transcription factor [Campylobacterales bacterium]|nr:response regulator transcription factor [Campylobacterales bacterium]